jgi:hypothetical protein
VDGANRGEICVAKFGPDGKAASYPLITKEAALAISEPLSRSASVATESTKTVVVKKAAAKKAPLKTVAVKKTGAKNGRKK